MALHHIALTAFAICALPLWYLTGVISDVPPDSSTALLHENYRRALLLFAVFTAIFLIGDIAFRVGRLPRSWFQIAVLILLFLLTGWIFVMFFTPIAKHRCGRLTAALYLSYLLENSILLGQIILSQHE